MIGYGTSPQEVLDVRSREGLGRHRLCILIDDPAGAPEASAAYKGAGYRLCGREPLFVLDTAKRMRYDPATVRRVMDTSTAAAIARAAGSRQVFPQHLVPEDSECRLYAAFDNDTPIGWVRSSRTHPDRAWVSNLFVGPSYRRRGIGRALMSVMLDDDARYGLRWSVLLASLTGSMLYPHLGYELRGLLLVFSPARVIPPSGGRIADIGTSNLDEGRP